VTPAALAPARRRRVQAPLVLLAMAALLAGLWALRLGWAIPPLSGMITVNHNQSAQFEGLE
jgi:hypothetical protein